MSHSASPVTFEASYQPGSARFGRMFPTSLPVADWEDTELILLGLQMIESPKQLNADNCKIPAAYTYFGQFVDHDLTLDLVSSFERKVDPLCLRNFRTAALELDSVYGAGPHAAPYLYEGKDKGRLRLGTVREPLDHFDPLPDLAFDVPRWADDVPVIADARNDENLFVNQLQVALIRFHNRIYDTLKASSHPDPFAEAQQLVRLHYQHVVLRDYLPKIVSQKLIDDIFEHGRRLYDPAKCAHEAFMPIEFSTAAFRFGHAMVRNKYQIKRYPSDGIEVTTSSKPVFISIMTENSRQPPFDRDKQGSRNSLIGARYGSGMSSTGRSCSGPPDRRPDASNRCSASRSASCLTPQCETARQSTRWPAAICCAATR
ncbi:MAG: peroxidase family protein [Nevskia sp.]|nr:peroxidase family protein [Nevskia sp.]